MATIMLQETKVDTQRQIEMSVTNGHGYGDHDLLGSDWKWALRQADSLVRDFLEPWAVKFRLGLWELRDNPTAETLDSLIKINSARVDLVFDGDYLEYYQQTGFDRHLLHRRIFLTDFVRSI